jgi:hypothetical protein
VRVLEEALDPNQRLHCRRAELGEISTKPIQENRAGHGSWFD